MPDRTLLVADDDPGLRESLERTLTREGYRVLLASDGRAALERLQTGDIDLIVTDLKMPGLTGLELLRAAKAIAPHVDVILLTAFGTVEEAVKAMKDGAYDFLTKPFRREQLLKLIDKALERRELIERNKVLQQRLDDLLRQGAIVGGSPAFRRMMMLVEQVASSSTARRCRRRCWSPSCSATSVAPSPAPPAARRDASSWPTAAPSSWTRWTTSRR